MAGNTRRRRSRRGEGGQLREDLLMAAWAVLDETGSDEMVTARNVAERAGVSVSALYLHFASLDELKYELAFRVSVDRMDSAMRRVANASARDRVRARGQEVFDFSAAYPGLYRMLQMDAGSRVRERFEAYPTIRDSHLGPMIGALEEGMRAGRVPPGDPEVVACLLWMGTHGLASLMIALDEFPWPQREQLEKGMLDLLGHLTVAD